MKRDAVATIARRDLPVVARTDGWDVVVAGSDDEIGSDCERVIRTSD